MPELTPFAWASIAVGAFFVGAAKTGVVGGGIVAVPLMALAFPAKASTGLLLPILSTGDILAVILYRYHARWGDIARLLPCTLIGIAGGVVFMNHVTDAQLTPFIGALVLVMLTASLLMQQFAKNADVSGHPAFAWAMGILAGFATMTANAAGPVMAVYLLARGFDKTKFVGTCAWFFFIVNLCKMPFSAGLGLITRESLTINALMIPVVFAGGFAGYYAIRVMSQKFFTVMVRVLATLAAIRLLLS